MMKNAFYFILKALSVIKIFNFFINVNAGKQFDKKQKK